MNTMINLARRVPTSPRFLAAMVALSIVAGCHRSEGITQYEVERIAPAPAGPAQETVSRPERMLGGMLAGKDQVWFFKLTGPPEKIGPLTADFEQLMASVELSETGDVTWKLPAGWTEEAGQGMRFATLRPPGEDKLELTVIPLPQTSDDLDGQMLANVNRWRGQVGLPPATAESWKADTKQFGKVVAIDFEGTSSGGGMSSAPFANMMRSAPPQETPPAAAGPKLAYDLPESWRDLGAGGMRKAAFEVASTDGRVEITLIDLDRSAGDRLANINRWRGQVGLPPITESELATVMSPIPIAGQMGDFVELAGDPASEKPQSILGVIFDRGDQTWFLKLQGSPALAAAEKEHFLAFASSLKFE